MEDSFYIQAEDELFGNDWLNCYATEILDAEYNQTDVADVVDKLTCFNAHQKASLLQVLQENSKMFCRTLGIYPHRPNQCTRNPIQIQFLVCTQNLQTKLDHLIQIGVLVPSQESQ